MSWEQQTVQSCHAAIEAAQSIIPTTIEHPHLVICGVSNENTLLETTKRLDEIGIKYKPFYEADIENQLTAIATEPVYDNTRKHFRKYKLLKFVVKNGF